ncbi:MAG: ATPase [Atopobiaceae bacterium]|jgi:cell division septum initiation protein DivIVA
MQPGIDIEDLISEIEDIVNEAKPSFGGGGHKKIIDDEDIFAIIDEIRSKFPQEFQDARRIIKEQEETLDHARKQADAIIADAQRQAVVIASDQEVVRLAKQEAESIRDQAQQYERDTRYNAEQYADTVLSHLEENLKSVTSSVTRVRQTLNENSGVQDDNDNW